MPSGIECFLRPTTITTTVSTYFFLLIRHGGFFNRGTPLHRADELFCIVFASCLGEREGEGEVSIEAHRRKNCWRKIGGAEMHAFMGGLTLREQQQQQKDLFSGVYSIALFSFF